jgi:hypothetical protein
MMGWVKKVVGIVGAACLGAVLAACVSVEDTNAWAGVPVLALDTHSFFATLPMYSTVTDSGVEIRNYPNKIMRGSCFGSGFASGTVFNTVQWNTVRNCTAQERGCDNLFYIRNGRVIEYRPVGQCRTAAFLRPEPGWERFQ